MAHIKTICPVCKKEYFTLDTIDGFQWWCSEWCENGADAKEDSNTDLDLHLRIK